MGNWKISDWIRNFITEEQITTLSKGKKLKWCIIIVPDSGSNTERPVALAWQTLQ